MTERDAAIQNKFAALAVQKLIDRGWSKQEKASQIGQSLLFTVDDQPVYVHPPLGMGGFAISETAERVRAEAWAEANRPSAV